MAGILVIPVHAQTTSEFGYQLHPEKLLENTEGTLQIFVTSNEMMVPKVIENLKAISSDNSIIEITGIDEGNDRFTKNISLTAKKAGISGIVLAAPGFSSKEISFEVFNNNNYPTQILMKITPDSFPIDGPKYGHVAVELVTTGGLPTLALEDTTIHLSTPNTENIKLKNSEMTIPKGEYYALTEFEITSSGDSLIFAESEGMTRISSIIKILEPPGPLTISVDAIPSTYNSYSGASGYAVVQLVDSEGIPVLAEEDIHLKLNVENPDSSINTSHDFREVLFDKEELVIEKGSYSAFTKFTPRTGLGDIVEEYEQEFTMFVSVDGYLAGETVINILHDQLGALEGEGPAVTRVVPFLTTGEEEIIAVTYYETEVEVVRKLGGSTQGVENIEIVSVIVPVQAKNDHEVIFSSSELDTVNPIHPIMKHGGNVVVVLGKTGTMAPEDGVTFSITDNEGVKTVIGDPRGPLETELDINVESLLPKILAEKEFPMIGYLVEGNEEETEEGEGTGEEEGEGTGEEETEDEEADPRLGVTSFIEEGVLTFSANELIEIDYVTIKQNQEYALMSAMSNEVGTGNLEYQFAGFKGSTELVSYTTDPAEIHVSFPKNILANSKTLATVQLLDSIGNPVYTKKDTEIKLVSNDEQVLQIPQELTIKNGDYFTTFEIDTNDEGLIELALLSEDFALTKYDINVVDISPELSLELLGSMNWNERVEAKLSVSIPEITTALDGFNVEWETEGGEIRSVDRVTNNNGVASLNIIPNEGSKISVTATVSGNGLSSTTITKTANILNLPVVEVEVETAKGIMGTEVLLDTYTLILIIIPVAIGATLFMLKRMDKLDMITERIPMGDKIEEIKEKISDIRNR